MRLKNLFIINNCYKMKTKHLFYTVALAGFFAACTNEDVVESPVVSVDSARPTVSNVTLGLGDAESRLSFNGKFNWVDGDKIAVMLMDQNNTGVRYGSSTKTEEWEALSWSERYHLIDYVHTNFPFYYNSKSGEFDTEANMLEGNYFIVYPSAEFDGKRQAIFDIAEQKQVGNTQQSRFDAYAQNQRLVGYARLDAAEGSSKLRARMTEVLAPVRINIQSNCTEVAGEPLQIRKIVLTHPTFHSKFSIDPTSADYENWNLTEYNGLVADNNQEKWDYTTFFNYANYLTATGIRDSKGELYLHELEGSQDAEDYVFNATKIGDVADVWDEVATKSGRDENAYYYDEAIRAIVKPLWKDNYSENVTRYIEVYTYAENGEDAYTLTSGSAAKLGVIAMLPPFVNAEGQALELFIYTNKGLVGPVNLSNKLTGNTSKDVQTTDEVKAADPRMGMKDVDVIIDDDDVIATPSSKIINNTDDLANYVEYYTVHATDTDVEIELTNDVTIDDALAAKIKTMKADKGINEIALIITKNMNCSMEQANVRLAVTAAQADILEYLEISEDVLVEVESGAVVDVTPGVHNYMSASSNLNILVDAGGTLNYIEDNSSVGGWSDVADGFAAEYVNTIVENNGTVNIKADVSNHAGLQLTNNGTMNVEAGAYIQLSTESVNTLNGVINVAEGARLSGTNNWNVKNYGTIVTKGNIYDIANVKAEQNAEKILPGRIVIDAAAAQTKLTKNEGQVIYNVLPTAAVEVAEGCTAGMFVYETSENVSADALATHHVTNATINGATLTVGGYGKNVVSTNLHSLVLNNGSKLQGAYWKYEYIDYANRIVYGQAKLEFANCGRAVAAWDNNYAGYNTFRTEGDVTIEQVAVDMAVTGTVASWNTGKVTLLKDVDVFVGAGAGKVDLNAVEVTVGDGNTYFDHTYYMTPLKHNFAAASLSADSQKTSKVYVSTNAEIEIANYAINYITISGQQINTISTITGGIQ